jgi:O-antigen/teichoic acid export membrane protein
LIVFLYGKEYKLASSVLVIHIWAGIFIGLTVVSGKWLIIENLTRHSMYRYGLGALLNIILNVCLISNMGIIGAAYSTLISYAFTGLFYDLLFKETRYLFYMKINALNLITGTTRLIKQ